MNEILGLWRLNESASFLCFILSPVIFLESCIRERKLLKTLNYVRDIILFLISCGVSCLRSMDKTIQITG